MKLKCTKPACPVGLVILEPKDKGLGTDNQEIQDKQIEDYICPRCLYPLEEVEN